METNTFAWKKESIGSLIKSKKILVKNGFAQGGYNQSGDGIPHIRPFNVSTEGNIDLTQIKYVAPLAEDSPYLLQENDVIFNNTNSEDLVGKTAIFNYSEACALSNHMTYVRVLDGETIDAYWLAKKLHHLWKKRVFKSLCRRYVGQASIGLDRLSSIELFLPSIDEQRAISQSLKSIQESLEARQREILFLEELLASSTEGFMSGNLLAEGLVEETNS